MDTAGNRFAKNGLFAKKPIGNQGFNDTEICPVENWLICW